MSSDLGLESIVAGSRWSERGRFFARKKSAPFAFWPKGKKRIWLAAGLTALAGVAVWYGVAQAGRQPQTNAHSPAVIQEASQVEGLKAESTTDIDVDVQSQSRTSGANSRNSSSTNVIINGQRIETSDGNVHKRVVSDDGNTTVDISVESSSYAGGNSQ